MLDEEISDGFFCLVLGLRLWFDSWKFENKSERTDGNYGTRFSWLGDVFVACLSGQVWGV